MRGDEQGTQQPNDDISRIQWCLVAVRRARPKFSKELLTSSKILAQRSAVPAVFSRTTANPLKRKILTYEEKDRLLRMGKRPRKGPFNAIIDPTEVGAGSALLEVSEAAKNSGTYDVWEASPTSCSAVKVRIARQLADRYHL